MAPPVSGTLAFRGTVPAALPDSVIIDRAGRIAATVIGRAAYGNLCELIRKASARR